jgi:hypothetical protein
MVTPGVDFRHPINALSAWVSRLRTSSDDIPTVGELSRRAVEAFLGRDGAERVAVEHAARAYEHTSRGNDPYVHTHAVVPSVDGIVDLDGLDTGRLTVEVDPDEPWGSSDYERWTAEAAEAAARRHAGSCREAAAIWGRAARDARLDGSDPSEPDGHQRYYQRRSQLQDARERVELQLAVELADDEIGRSRGGWSM